MRGVLTVTVRAREARCLRFAQSPQEDERSLALSEPGRLPPPALCCAKVAGVRFGRSEEQQRPPPDAWPDSRGREVPSRVVGFALQGGDAVVEERAWQLLNLSQEREVDAAGGT